MHQVKKKAVSTCKSSTYGFSSSGAEESRTPDLCIANAALSQLSYRPSHIDGEWSKTLYFRFAPVRCQLPLGGFLAVPEIGRVLRALKQISNHHEAHDHRREK